MSEDGEYNEIKDDLGQNDELGKTPPADGDLPSDIGTGNRGPKDEIAKEMANLQNPNIQNPSIVPTEEQEKKAAEMEMKRQNKNESSDRMNSNLGGINSVKALINRKKSKEIRGKIEVLEKENKEKNEKLKTLLRKKKMEQRDLRNKLMAQIVRIFPEIVSGVGIPVAIWEIIKLASKNKELKRVKADMKKIVTHLSNNEKEFKNKEEKMETELYNLQNVFKREGPGDFTREPVK